MMDKKSCKTCKEPEEYNGELVCWLNSDIDYIFYCGDDTICEEYKRRDDGDTE